MSETILQGPTGVDTNGVLQYLSLLFFGGRAGWVFLRGDFVQTGSVGTFTWSAC